MIGDAAARTPEAGNLGSNDRELKYVHQNRRYSNKWGCPK
jgi:hypothetical protein